MKQTWTIHTARRDELIDITAEVAQAVARCGLRDGVVVVYCPHTTAGIAINENADPDVRRDVLMRLNEIYPWSHPQDRHAEGNTAAHLKAMTVGTSQLVLVSDGKLQLGRWQGIYFCEFDGPRQRQIWVKTLS